MARLGAFDRHLEPRAWFTPLILPEGWFSDELLTAPAAVGDVTLSAAPTVALPAFPGVQLGRESDWFLASGSWTAGIWYDAAPWSDVIIAAPTVALPAFPATTLTPGEVTLTVAPTVALPAFPATTLAPGEVTLTAAPTMALPAFPATTLAQIITIAAQRTSLRVDSALALTLQVDSALGLSLALASPSALTLSPDDPPGDVAPYVLH